MKTGMFKKFFSTISAPIVKAAANIYLSILPKKAYLKFMRKHDVAGVFNDVSDETLLKGRAEVRIYTVIKAAAMTIGIFLGYVLFKKYYA